MPSMEHFFSSFGRFLGLEPSFLSSIVYRRGVDLTLVAHFAKGNAQKVCSMRALTFCLFARFLFPNYGLEFDHASLVDVAEQSTLGKDPMPLMIGETLVGLDMAKTNPSSMLSGSPVLLQVSALNFPLNFELVTLIF